MKTRILMLLAAFVISLFMASCSDTSNQKIDVEQYRENLKKQKNSITPEEREKAMKSMFPNYKPKKENK